MLAPDESQPSDRAPSAGWDSSQTLGLLAAAAAGLGAFVAVEARVREPLVPLVVFRRRPTVTALVLMVCGMGTVLSAFSSRRCRERGQAGARLRDGARRRRGAAAERRLA
jgi:hypothetical protein